MFFSAGMLLQMVLRTLMSILQPFMDADVGKIGSVSAFRVASSPPSSTQTSHSSGRATDLESTMAPKSRPGCL